MRGVALLLLVAFVGAERGAVHWARTMVGARLDSQEMRLNALGARLEEMVAAVKSQGKGNVDDMVNDIEHRIEDLEGHDCGKNYVSCGRNSGECVSAILVCDNHKDCENNHDENDATCANPVPPGKTWSGRVRWTSCVARGEDKITLVVTSNKRNPMLPSLLQLTAVVALTYEKDGESATDSFNVVGTYGYGNRRVILQPSDDTNVRIGVVCDDAGVNLARCRFLNEADLHECGHALLASN